MMYISAETSKLVRSPDPTSRSYYAPVNTLTALTPLNDPKVPTFQPARTALDHWLARSGQVQSKYITHISHSVCSDHSAVIIRIQDPGIYLPITDKPINTQPSVTTRTSPPFRLPVDKTNIQLYQLGNQELRTQTASTRREIYSLTAMTKDRKLDISTIDSLAEDIMGLISEYYTLATQIWPTHQSSHYTTTAADTASPQRHYTSLLKPPMTKFALRNIRRLSRLRNESAAAVRTQRETPSTPHTNPEEHPTQQQIPQPASTSQRAQELLETEAPPTLTDTPGLCRKAIASIVRRAHRKLDARLQEKENQRYDRNRKQYPKEMKIAARLLPMSKDLPKLRTVTDPQTGLATSEPTEVVRVVEDHFQEELKRTTPDTLPAAPWTEDTHNPDCYELKPHPGTDAPEPDSPNTTLNSYLTRGHYDQALSRTAQGKAPGPDGIPNEIPTHLPREVHDIVYALFQIMAANHYTPVA